MAYSLKIRRIIFVAKCVRSARLRSFSAHMLRGAFGNTLTWLARTYNDDRGSQNRVYEELYNRVFKVNAAGRGRRKTNALAGGVHYNPYVPECEPFDDRHFNPCEILSFSFVLTGDFACQHASEFVTVVKLMVEGDLGGNIDCFTLERATEDLGGGEYYADGKYLALPNHWDWSDSNNICRPVSGVKVTFCPHSPLCIQNVEKEALMNLPFETFFKEILMRVDGLCCDFSEEAQSLNDAEGIMRRARQISVREADISVNSVVLDKRGNSQWGVSGAISYTGELREFLPYIDVCSVLHIGMSTSKNGYGKYNWSLS